MKGLIELAKGKGFETDLLSLNELNNGDCEIITPANNDRLFYIFMCELQKWLRDEYSIIVTFEISGAGIYPDIITFDESPFKITTINYSCPINEMDDCMKEGLKEALKLIK